MLTEEPLVTVQEAARQLYVDPSTVRRWIAAGVLEAITLPGGGERKVRRIRSSTLDRLLRREGKA